MFLRGLKKSRNIDAKSREDTTYEISTPQIENLPRMLSSKKRIFFLFRIFPKNKPFLAGESFRKSRAAHVKACTGLTPKELMYVRLRTKESREIFRQRQNALVAQRKQAALEAMDDLSASTRHQLVMLPFATSGRSWSFTCAACTLTRPTLADIRKSGKKKPVLKLLPTKPDRDGGETAD